MWLLLSCAGSAVPSDSAGTASDSADTAGSADSAAPEVKLASIGALCINEFMADNKAALAVFASVCVCAWKHY